MNSVEISLLDQALLDLEAGRQFYENQEQGLGEHFLNSVFDDLHSLREFAGIHPVHFSCQRMLTKRFPFAIYYEVHDGTARIIAVLDMRQNPDGIRSLLEWRTAQTDE